MLGFVNKLFISVQLIFFLDHVLLFAELAQKFKFLKIAVWRSDSTKRNFGRFIFIIWNCSVWKSYKLLVQYQNWNLNLKWTLIIKIRIICHVWPHACKNTQNEYKYHYHVLIEFLQPMTQKTKTLLPFAPLILQKFAF